MNKRVNPFVLVHIYYHALSSVSQQISLRRYHLDPQQRIFDNLVRLKLTAGRMICALSSSFS